MASTKPIILLVHGAWHLPSLYDPLKVELEKLGYEWLCPQLPSIGADVRGVTWEADVQCVRDLVIPLFDQGREVVTIGHSYGGIPASVSTAGLSVAERAARGEKGGFKCIIFLASFAGTTRGMDLLKGRGGVWQDWVEAGEPYTKNHSISLKETCIPHLFNDIPEEEAREVFKRLVPHSQDAFETPSQFIVDDITIPIWFVIGELDQAIPLAMQEQLVAALNLKNKKIYAGHSAFISQPKRCAELIVEMVEETDEKGSV